jgi:hypothetical protein
MTDLHSQVTRAPARVGSPDREVATRGVGGRRRTWAGAALGAATGAAAYGVLAAAVVPAPLVVVVALALLLAVPTSPHLARRVALNGSVVLGWVCTTWWVRWPLPVNHGALVVAAAAAGLVWFVGCSSDPGRRLRRLRPRFVAADALLPTAGLVALAAMWRWAFPGSPQHALAAMLPGIDNVAHFHMFSTMRSYGATTQALGASPDGSRWAFDMYPQGFHAVAGTISELLRPHLPAGPEMLVAYTQAVAVVVVLGTVVLTAAMLSVTGLRARPLVALPVVTCAWTAFLWQPGQNVLADGFANFWLAALAAGTALVLSLSPHRRLALPEVVAVGGLLVVVAHAWAPLLVIGGPAVLALLYPFRPLWSDRGLRARVALAVAVLAVAGLAVGKAVIGLFLQVDVGTLVTAFGGIHGTNPLPAFTLLVAACYACLAGPAIVVRRGGTGVEEVEETARRSRVLLLAPVLGVMLGAALLVGQMRTVGTSSYYFVKYFMGCGLVLAALVPAVCGSLVAVITVPRRHGVRIVAAVAAVVAVTQLFGVLPGRSMPLFDHARSGTAGVKGPYSADRMAAGILAAVRASDRRDGFEQDYLSIGRDGAVQAFYPDGWFHGSLATLSGRSADRMGVLRTRVDDVGEAVPLARQLLTDDPRLTLLVPRAYASGLRTGLADQALSRRVASVEAQGER